MKKKETSEEQNQEKPKITIIDRRSALLEDDADGEAATQASDLDERFPSFVEKLKHDAEEKDKKLKEYIAAYKEKNLENDEFRSRLQKDNESRLDQFKANLFSRLVPILDNLKRANGAATDKENFDALKSGIDMVVRQFTRELEDNQVTVISTQGRKFNPKTDEAFLTEPTEEADKHNDILEELESGYMFKDKLIKAARVKIAVAKD
ncbi:MAG: nucleotide exchange factor GrpE [Candidatus Nitrohelix vancouverensis]|uniref:Protein GrpE n=1 Tax=Candidatus Nitrohelix vancouverensis TaxID=2705534 RepID=A0A7T0C4C7_9BACT|nr:MAG: nucleotide exchange factor GrpE [Candidatus Nitrohelix vancouverensis]